RDNECSSARSLVRGLVGLMFALSMMYNDHDFGCIVGCVEFFRGCDRAMEICCKGRESVARWQPSITENFDLIAGDQRCKNGRTDSPCWTTTVARTNE